jgi:molecular chaperone HscB
MFNLPERFAIDPLALESAWRAVQSAVHPDKFVSASDAQKRMALQYSTQINEAHETLKDTVKRAAYLCHLHGVDIDPERNTAMPPDFLVQQMEWRESLEDAVAARALHAILQLEMEVQAALHESVVLIEHLIDSPTPDYHRAAEEVRRMMFLNKFNSQIGDEQRRLAHGTATNR